LCSRDSACAILAALVEVAHGSTRALEGPLHLGVIPTIAPFLLPRVLPALRKTYRNLKLFLHEDLTDELHRQLSDGMLDAMRSRCHYDLAAVETLELFDDKFLLAARVGTSLVDAKHYRFNRLHAGSVLLLREGHCLREHAIDACKLRDARKSNPVSASSLLTLIEMVDADYRDNVPARDGGRLGAAPRHAGQDVSARGQELSDDRARVAARQRTRARVSRARRVHREASRWLSGRQRTRVAHEARGLRRRSQRVAPGRPHVPHRSRAAHRRRTRAAAD
jgi:hypothetical protein